MLKGGDRNSAVFSSGRPRTIRVFLATAQLRKCPEVETLLFPASLLMMSTAVVDCTSTTADWANDTHFISHISKPAKFIAHALKHQMKLSLNSKRPLTPVVQFCKSMDMVIFEDSSSANSRLIFAL